jgi:hypothetical protein
MFDLTPGFRLYASHRMRQLDALSVIEAQRQALIRLVRSAASTRFGREHRFDKIKDTADFQRHVPLRTYKDFWEEYWSDGFPVLRDCTWPGLIRYFALSSGTTTGATKFIPYTKDMGKVAFAGMRDLLVHHVINRPASRVLGGKGMMLGGTTGLSEKAPGVYAGDVSGIAAKNFPWWMRSRVTPSQEIALIPDWAEKIDRLAPIATNTDVRLLGGSPNWLLLFFDKLASLEPEKAYRATSHIPNLELIVHGGMNFAPYRKRFADYLEGSAAETREAFSASEGFIAVADRGDGEGMRMILDQTVFYEFVPTDELDSHTPSRHWVANIECDVEYAVFVTTPAGLWAYNLGDTVKFVDRRPPRLFVTGRTTQVLSAFGEHLINQEIEEAVAQAADSIGAAVTEFAVSPIFPNITSTKGWHHYIVEFQTAELRMTRLETFAQSLDSGLRRLNADYAAQRQNDYGIAPPRIQLVRPGTFAAWMESRHQLGGQHKVPRIMNDAKLFESLQRFAAPLTLIDYRGPENGRHAISN